MCLALWGPGACDFPSGLKVVWKHATFHVLAYSPLLFEGISVTPLRGVEVLPPQTGLEDVRWSGGRPFLPRYDDAVSCMRVNVPENDTTGTPARIVPEMREAYIPSTLVLPQACLSYRRAARAQKPPPAPPVCRPPSPRGPPDGPPGSAGGGTGGRRRFGTTRGGGRSASRGGVSRGQSTGPTAVTGPVGRGLTPRRGSHHTTSPSSCYSSYPWRYFYVDSSGSPPNPAINRQRIFPDSHRARSPETNTRLGTGPAVGQDFVRPTSTVVSNQAATTADPAHPGLQRGSATISGGPIAVPPRYQE